MRCAIRAGRRGARPPRRRAQLRAIHGRALRVRDGPFFVISGREMSGTIAMVFWLPVRGAPPHVRGAPRLCDYDISVSPLESVNPASEKNRGR